MENLSNAEAGRTTRGHEHEEMYSELREEQDAACAGGR